MGKWGRKAGRDKEEGIGMWMENEVGGGRGENGKTEE